MKIIEMNGGLGNQLCQYVFGRFLEINFGYEIVHDPLFFDREKLHNGFELQYVFEKAKINSIRNFFELDVWLNMVNLVKDNIEDDCIIKLADILHYNGMDIVAVLDEYFWTRFDKVNDEINCNYEFIGTNYNVLISDMTNPNHQIYKDIEKHENIYFAGAWINEGFADAIKPQLLEELKFAELKDEFNINYREAILSAETAVGVHIRRGDFVLYNINAAIEKFAKVLRELKRDFAKKQKSKLSFFVFSDDIEWCKENKELIGLTNQDDVTLIEGNNTPQAAHIDMQLMAYCDYLIHDFWSSFCLGATFTTDKKIIRIPVK